MAYKTGLRFAAAACFFACPIPPWVQAFALVPLGALLWLLAWWLERKEEQREKRRTEALEQLADEADNS